MLSQWLRVSINVDGFKDLRYIGTKDIPPDTVVYQMSGRFIETPTRTSIQVGPNLHIEDTLGRYVNHSCDPTVKVVGTQLVSVKTICAGDSVTFNYNETEERVSNPFQCNCCGKIIIGKKIK
jgi:hypothetical protein